MKKSIYILGAAALVMFAACQKEDNGLNKGVELKATIEQQEYSSETKTALGTGNTVVWSENDKIKVHTDDGVEDMTLQSGAGSTTGSFGNTTGANPDYAIYPSSAYSNISSSTITFNLPASQKYVENSFDNGANVAVAKVVGSNMSFKNVCGVLKLQLKGSMKVKTIKVVGKNNEKLWGEFSADASSSNPSAVKTAETVTDTMKTIVLDCSHFGESAVDAGDGGVQLDSQDSTVFYIIVPVGAFANGFDATIYDAAGDSYKTTISSTSAASVIERKTITKMNPKAVSLLPEGYTELKYLRSDASTGQYMSTGINTWNNTIEYDIKLSVENQDSGYANYTYFGGYDSWHASGHYIPAVCTYLSLRVPQSFTSGPNPSSGVDIGIANNQTGIFSLKGNTISWSLGTSAFFDRGSDFTCNHTFHLYGIYVSSPCELCATSMYFVKIWLNESIVRFLIPAQNSLSVKGLYDIVNGVFYTNLSTVPDSVFTGDVLTD